ncbi:MAG: class I SAM-dependent methyltransferase [Firmicutes bacterium]|nr:class I SAM-dependent methyltransferase [Bacillota bacterium]
MLKDLVLSSIKSCKVFYFNQVQRDDWVAGQAADLSPGASVLDVGAGSCPYRMFFLHCDYKAQDFQGLTPEQLREQSGYGKIDYHCDATNIPVPDSCYDAVLCTEMLEHVPEPINVIKEIARILKPGGKVIMTAPLGSGIHQSPYHFYGGYTPYWYDKFLSEFGFEEISVEPNGGFFKFYGQESMRFIQMTVPWKLNAAHIFRFLWAPAWLLCLICFFLLIPLCNLLDSYDKEKDFTVGYHVTARKACNKT